MGIEVERATADDAEEWDDLVERSPHGTPFHTYDFLEVLADHSGATLHPLIGYKGQEPVGLFPGFEVARGPVTALFSPPPDLKVAYLGPALVNQGGLKRRKAERRHRRFVEGALEAFADGGRPEYVHVRTAPGYDDCRTFTWNGFDATPVYTYRVDLARGEDALLSAFSRDARGNVRSVEEADCRVRRAGEDAIRRILTQVKARHDEQDEHYGVTPEFVVDLYERTPDGVVRPYVCTVDGEFVTGMVTVALDATVYRWQGGVKPDVDLPVNDYLDWRIMCDAIEDGRASYDLVGATNRRLTGYKAKFDPELAIHVVVERGTWYTDLAASLYRRFR